MKLFALCVLTTVYSFVSAMEIITLPTKSVLQDMLEDTTLQNFIEKDEEDAFYALAEKHVAADELFVVIRKFYSSFRFQQLINSIPKNLYYPKMGECVSMNYVYFARKLFEEKAPNFWLTIAEELAGEVRAQGYKEFSWFNFKADFLGTIK